MTRTPGLFALTRRRFATPRSAAIVIIALTAFAAFVIAVAPRALVGVVRAEVAHQVADMPAISRDLSASLIGLPAFGPPTDPAVAEDWDEGAGDVFGALGQLLADNRDGLEPALAPLVGDAQFAAYGRALSKTCMTFVSKASIDAGIVEKYGLQRDVEPVENCRNIGKKDMRRNEATPEIRVDPDTYQVWVDGEKVGSEPLDELPMAQRYFLF